MCSNIKQIFLQYHITAQKLRRDYQRAQCIARRNAGMTCRKISTIVGISKASVQRALKRFEERDEQWKEGCMQVAAVSGGGRVNFWSVITSEGTGCFRINTENTNSDVYCSILENYLISMVQLYQMENNYIYQHDNSRYNNNKEEMRSDFNIDHEEFIDSTNCVFDAVESKDERVTANRHKRIRENAKECYLSNANSQLLGSTL
ncbi:unnamed protein product [Rotaria socialis]|uniref:Uncharacterized protein n=1 Tax=Rotaria socialis TaxID=392032 RepID=A0A821SJT5_9BILA|nr:unnamed protein product [Rotaria socialis]CAF4861025.1 unnamed protein product [Rotaria socialis]